MRNENTSKHLIHLHFSPSFCYKFAGVREIALSFIQSEWFHNMQFHNLIHQGQGGRQHNLTLFLQKISLWVFQQDYECHQLNIIPQLHILMSIPNCPPGRRINLLRLSRSHIFKQAVESTHWFLNYYPLYIYYRNAERICLMVICCPIRRLYLNLFKNCHNFPKLLPFRIFDTFG